MAKMFTHRLYCPAAVGLQGHFKSREDSARCPRAINIGVCPTGAGIKVILVGIENIFHTTVKL